MRIVVMGAGAIGSVFGGFLARAGHEVTLVGRAWHMDAVDRDGLRISGIWGDHKISRLAARRSLGNLEACDLILLAVKSYQTKAAVEEIEGNCSKPIPILSLQNGLGNLETIAAGVGVDRTLGGRVIFGAEIRSPGEVAVTVYADPVAIGPMRGSRFPDEEVDRFASAIDQSGIPCFAAKEIERYIWGKVLYNVVLNAPAAILGINYGRLLETQASRDLMKDLIAEAFAVAHAEGLRLDWASPEEYAVILFERLIPPTASHFPSMLQDIQHGKRTEIDALNGAVVRAGIRHGVPVPVNETLTRLIAFKEKREGEASRSGDAGPWKDR